MNYLGGQLGKITFIFYPVSFLPGVGVTYVPMYNPTSFSVNHGVKYDSKKVQKQGDAVKRFLHLEPRTLNLELFFDGTGASPSNLSSFAGDASLNSSSGVGRLGSSAGVSNLNQSVEFQIQTFLKAAYQIAGALHQPNYVMVVWGTFLMTGVLESANVTYTMFASDGTPLRAKMAITIKEHIDKDVISKILGLESPDISKTVVVNEGDTLPLLCQREYGDPSLYLKVAEANNLKNPRKLKQGMELLFPPIKDLN